MKTVDVSDGRIEDGATLLMKRDVQDAGNARREGVVVIDTGRRIDLEVSLRVQMQAIVQVFGIAGEDRDVPLPESADERRDVTDGADARNQESPTDPREGDTAEITVMRRGHHIVDHVDANWSMITMISLFRTFA